MMGNPTKEQWAEVEQQIDCLYDTVYLRCDGYLVQAGLHRTGSNKLSIVVYVNGFVKGKWFIFDGPSEEARRFYRPSVRNRWPAKFIKRMERVIGKRKCKAEGYYDKRTIYMPEWNRPRPFIRHLIKNNASIEVLDYHAYHIGLEELKHAENE